MNEAVTPKIYTVGHGLLSFEELRALLARHAVDTVIDVRSQPYSGRAPHFNEASLAAGLAACGIAYRWIPELGGRPASRLLTESGSPDYERMAREPATAKALDDLVAIATTRIQAILCSESKPQECHRSRMLEPELARRGLWVEHILHSGEVAAQPTIFA